MKQLLLLFIFMLAFSCAKQVETTTTTLKIFSSFATAANPDFDGGILVFGSNRNTGEHISVSFAHEFDQQQVEISKGKWDLMAIGFLGVGGSGNFRGTNKCAMINGANIVADEETLEITLSAANCVNPMFGSPSSKISDQFKPVRVTSCIDSKDAYNQDCSNEPGVAKSFKFNVRGFEGPNTRKFGPQAFRSSECQTSLTGFSKLPMLDMSGTGKPFFMELITYSDAACNDLQKVSVFNIGKDQKIPEGVSTDTSNGTYNDFYIAGPVCTSGTETQFLASHLSAPSPGLGSTIYICNATQWNNYASLDSLHVDGNKLILFKDIDFNGSNTMIGFTNKFNGELEGRGRTLKNITMPLFADIDSGIIRDITIDGVNITFAGDDLGALASQIWSDSPSDSVVIERVTIKNGSIVSANNNKIGGLVGTINASGYPIDLREIKVQDLKVVGNHNVGGVVGYVNGDGGSNPFVKMDHISYSTMNSVANYLKGTSNVGGIAGMSKDLRLFSAYTNGSIIINNDSGSSPLCASSIACNFGGILGENFLYGKTEITEAYSKMKITNTDLSATGRDILNVGGIAGHLQGLSNTPTTRSKITGSKYDGLGIQLDLNAAANATNVGGIVGYADINSTIIQSINLADVNASDYGYNVGGLVGMSNNTNNFIMQSSTKDISITGYSKLGGLVGFSQGFISNSFTVNPTFSPSSGASFIGGIAGHAKGNFTEAINDIYVELSSIPASAVTYSGGLFGKAESEFLDISKIVFNYTGSLFAKSTGNSIEAIVGCFMILNTSSFQACHYTNPNTGDLYNKFEKIKFGLTNSNSLTCASHLATLSSGDAITCSDTSATFTTTTFSDASWVGTNNTSTDNSNGLPMLDLQVERNLHGYAIGTMEDPIIVNSNEKFQAIGNNDYTLSRVYKLAEDGLGTGEIDFTASSLVPIGNAASPFLGKIIPNGVKLYNVVIDNSSSAGKNEIGIFGAAGKNETGSYRKADIGSPNDPLIIDTLSVTSTTSGDGEFVGGIVGKFISGYISAHVQNAVIYADRSSGTQNALGGLVGYLGDPSIDNEWNKPRIESSSYQGNINSTGGAAMNGVGGLVGVAFPASINRAKFSGNITVDKSGLITGGLIGQVAAPAAPNDLFIAESAANVSFNDLGTAGITTAGGLIGKLNSGSDTIVVDSYARVNANFTNGDIGGLLGDAASTSQIDFKKVYAYQGLTFSTNVASTKMIGFASNSGTINFNESIAYNYNLPAHSDPDFNEMNQLNDFQNELIKFSDFSGIWGLGSNLGRLKWEVQNPYVLPLAN